MRNLAVVVALLVVLGSAMPASAKGGTVDKAYLQEILDTWSSFDLNKAGQYYVQGPGHLFFDIMPLKYNSWDEYKAGVQPLLKQYSSFKFKINDDLEIHPAGNLTWIVATLDVDTTTAGGEKQPLVMRWTAVFEKQGGRWIIQHEHVSVPMSAPK